MEDYLLKEKLALSQARSKRLKKARTDAENLLEQKSRELFEANRALEATQLKLKDDIKQATNDLKATNKRLQASLNDRSAFIGRMSHEVRTPLNAIIGLSEILLTTKLNDAQTDYLDTINGGAKSLIVLLNDMLDITKIEAGRVDINQQPENTHRIHKNIVAMFAIEAKNKGLYLRFQIDKSVPQTISIDKGRYQQIINNLITNSLKNTHEGGISIDVSYQSGSTPTSMGILQVNVTDTGVGIGKNHIERIFDPYEQVGRPDQGVGLGLAICQQLSELMMGHIGCESRVGYGSVFRLNLPVLALPDVEQSRAESISPELSSLPPLQILIAEDNPINQKVITAQLAQLGQQADITNNGAEAMEKLESYAYDVVILDIMMPIMNGEETIKAIRSSPKKIAQHYCIALTAASFSDQRDRLLNLGFDAFLSKPLSLDQLSSALKLTPKVHVNELNEERSLRENVSHQSTKPATFDFSYLESQFGDAHKEIFKEIAPVFLDHAYRELIELKAHADAENAEKLKSISHSMKGAASSIGLIELANTLLQIESKSSSGTVSQHIVDVEQMMLELKPLIEKELSALS